MTSPIYPNPNPYLSLPLSHLLDSIRSTEGILSNVSLLSKLPDKGQKAKNKLFLLKEAERIVRTQQEKSLNSESSSPLTTNTNVSLLSSYTPYHPPPPKVKTISSSEANSITLSTQIAAGHNGKKSTSPSSPIPSVESLTDDLVSLFSSLTIDISDKNDEISSSSSSPSPSSPPLPLLVNHSHPPSVVKVDELKSSLYLYQQRALQWMQQREISSSKSNKNDKNNAPIVNSHSILTNISTDILPLGGLIADDCGLGKTLQMLSFIQWRKKAESIKKKMLADSSASIPPSPSLSTLIIAPKSLISQWASEISKHFHSVPSTLTHFTYYGNARNDIRRYQDLMPYDIVITTYSMVRLEYEKHLEYEEERERAGKSKNKISSFSSFPPSPLFSFPWNRIVIDESHFLRNTKSLQSIAVFSLPSHIRWVITATPIQNSLYDLYGIFTFLKVKPLNEKKIWREILKCGEGEKKIIMDKIKIILKSIMIRRVKPIANSQSGGLLNPLPHDNQSVSSSLSSLSLPPKSIEMVYLTLSLPEKLFYDSLFEQFCEYFEEESKRRRHWNPLARGGGGKDGGSGKGEIFKMILKLRQTCNGVKLVMESMGIRAKKGEEMNDEMNDEDEESESESDIGSDNSNGDENDPEEKENDHHEGKSNNSPPSNIMKSNERIRKFLRKAAEVSSFDMNTLSFSSLSSPSSSPSSFSIDHNDMDSLASTLGSMNISSFSPSPPTPSFPFVHSTKVTWVLSLLHHLSSSHPTDKVVIFSQFTTMLSILSSCLSRHNILHQRFDGSMSVTDQQHSLLSFRDDPQIRVLLLSLTAGGVGLNLTSANHCILFDAWWNPFVELQAMERIHRVGQKKEVKIYKIYCKDTIEERMKEIQMKKEKISDDILSEKKSSEKESDKYVLYKEKKKREKVTMEEMIQIFKRKHGNTQRDKEKGRGNSINDNENPRVHGMGGKSNGNQKGSSSSSSLPLSVSVSTASKSVIPLKIPKKIPISVSASDGTQEDKKENEQEREKETRKE